MVKIKAIILCAGYATRLYPLTLNKPKPLLLVGGKPMIEYIVENIDEIAEVDTIYVVTNHKFKSVFDVWLSSYDALKKIKIIDDCTLSNEDRLGAIGDINFVIDKEKVVDDLLVVAGDNLFDFDLDDLVDVMKKKNSSVLAVRDLKDPKLLAKKFGTILLDKGNKVVDFEEKPEHPKSSIAATAIYLFRKDDIVEISNCLRDRPNLDNSGDFIKYLIAKKPVYAYIMDGDWVDIGGKEELRQADISYGGTGEDYE